MTGPTVAMLMDGSLDAEEICPRQDLVVGEAVIQTYAKVSEESCLQESL